MAQTPRERAKAAVEKKAEARKKKKPLSKGKIAGGVLLLLVALIWFGMQKPKGTIKYGICRVFVETSLTYPITLKVTAAQEFGNEVRIEYTSTNEYGEYILSQATCDFRQDPNTTWALTRVLMNRDTVPDKKLSIFNASIPFIIANPPDLTLPPPPPTDLLDLKR